jgi:hypothetical protein
VSDAHGLLWQRVVDNHVIVDSSFLFLCALTLGATLVCWSAFDGANAFTLYAC